MLLELLDGLPGGGQASCCLHRQLIEQKTYSITSTERRLWCTLPFPPQAADSDQSDPLEGAGGRGQRTIARQEACSEQTRGQSQQGSHPNRWMELIDGWNIKTVYKSTMAHQQCPIAGKQADGPGLSCRKKGSYARKYCHRQRWLTNMAIDPWAE